MKRKKLLPTISNLATIVTFGIAAFAAGELHAQTAEPPKAKSTLLLEQKLEGLPGYIVQIVLIEGPPGWVGGRHYHPGHLFGYILEGSFEFSFDDVTSRTVGAGEVFYETPNTVMRSRNGSSTEWVKDIVFHIMRESDPPAVSVQ